TMNPAEYAGRSVLSPAYRDRWRGYRAVPRPGEDELLAMLRLMVFGEQPAVEVNGGRYSGSRQEPVYPQLGRVSDVAADLEALARGRRRGGGRRRRGPHRAPAGASGRCSRAAAC